MLSLLSTPLFRFKTPNILSTLFVPCVCEHARLQKYLVHIFIFPIGKLEQVMNNSLNLPFMNSDKRLSVYLFFSTHLWLKHICRNYVSIMYDKNIRFD